MIRIYCIAAMPVVPQCTGVDDAPLRALDLGGVSALVSDDRGERAPTVTELWQHEYVVERTMALGAVLPARFGLVFDSADALTGALRPHADRMRACLDGLRDLIELGVRVRQRSTDPAFEPVETPRTGVEYLRRAQAGVATAERASATVDRTVDALHEIASTVAEATTPPRPASDGARAFAVLAAEPAAADIRRVAATFDEVEVAVTGPWPPYSFGSVGDVLEAVRV